MVVDASAVVALFKEESTASLVEAILNQAGELFMPTVTLTEVALAGLEAGKSAATTAIKVRALGIEIVSVDEALAVASAEARRKYPIPFGDAFVYALSKARNLPVFTLDAEFAKTDAALVPLA